MTRLKNRRTPRLENLESRALLTAVGGPTAQEQYMLELINLARTNPTAIADRVTSNLDADVTATVSHYNVDLNAVKSAIASSPAQPPLAWNQDLANSATGHSQDQANTGVQSHTGSDGSTTEQRIQAAGYSNASTDGENAYAYSKSVDQAMEAFLIDWGVSSNGHRHNILQNDVPASQQYHDVGIGIVASNKPNFGPYVVTQDFGAQQNEKAQLIGVAFNDPNGTNFYSPGNGRGDVTVQVTNKATGQTQSVDTWASGGYEIALDPGGYTVTALVGNTVVHSQDVSIGTQNVEIDFNLSQPWQGTVVNPTPAPTPTPTPQPQAQMQAPTNQLNPTNLASAAIADLHSFKTWSTSWTSWAATPKSSF